MGAWETCAQPWQKCLESGCCAAHNFGCFKKMGVEYAQCRPLQHPCKDTTDWLCPGWWNTHEEVVAAPFGAEGEQDAGEAERAGEDMHVAKKATVFMG